MIRRHASLLVAALVAPALAAAQAPPVETPTPAPDRSTPVPAPAAPDEGAEAASAAPAIHGFLTVRYLVDDGKGLPYAAENGFDIQYARFNADGQVHPLVKYFVSLEAADVKLASGNVFREAYVVWSPKLRAGWFDRLVPVLRAGRMRRPAGIEALQDDGQLLAMDRSLVTGFLLNDDGEAADQDFRDIGIRADAVVGILETMAVGMGNGQTGTSASRPSDDDDSKDLLARFGVRLGDPRGRFFLRAGASVAAGQDNHTHLYSASNDVPVEYWNGAADLTLIAGPLLVQSEAAYGKRTLLDPVTFAGIDTATGSAAYVLIAWSVTGRGAPFARYAYREPTMDAGDEDFQRARDWTNEVTVGVNVALVRKRVTARAQYSLRSGFVPAHPAAAGLTGYASSLNGVAAGSVQVDF